MKKKILFTVLIVSTLIIGGIPLLLNISWLSEKVSWYFAGLRTPDYKMTYISLIGGIIGVWMTVVTTLLIQCILDTRNEKEKEKIISQIVDLFLLEEIKKNHKAMTTCDSGMHKQVAKDESVLHLIKNKEFLYISYFNREFSISQWNEYSEKLLRTDVETYLIVSKLYDCYKVVKSFDVGRITQFDLEKAGVYEYEKIYKKFEKRFKNLLVEEN